MRLLIWGGLALVALALAGFGAWIMRLPATPASGLAQPVAQDEMDAMLAALRPPKRARPLVAIIGINDATDTTDYLMPTGILRRADIADVVTLATQPGPVQALSRRSRSNPMRRLRTSMRAIPKAPIM